MMIQGHLGEDAQINNFKIFLLHLAVLTDGGLEVLMPKIYAIEIQYIYLSTFTSNNFFVQVRGEERLNCPHFVPHLQDNLVHCYQLPTHIHYLCQNWDSV